MNLVFYLSLFLSSILIQLTFGQINWQAANNGGLQWARGCDFVGRNMSSSRVSRDQCGRLCINTRGCTHFSYQNGVCWMKSGRVQQSDAIFNNNNFLICGIILIRQPNFTRSPFTRFSRTTSRSTTPRLASTTRTNIYNRWSTSPPPLTRLGITTRRVITQRWPTSRDANVTRLGGGGITLSASQGANITRSIMGNIEETSTFANQEVNATSRSNLKRRSINTRRNGGGGKS